MLSTRLRTVSDRMRLVKATFAGPANRPRHWLCGERPLSDTAMFVRGDIEHRV